MTVPAGKEEVTEENGNDTTKHNGGSTQELNEDMALKLDGKRCKCKNDAEEQDSRRTLPRHGQTLTAVQKCSRTGEVVCRSGR